MEQTIEKSMAKITGFGERLRIIRTLSNHTVRGLARKSGLSAGTISRAEIGNGQNVDATTLFKLAQALDVSMDYLWTGHAPKNGNRQ
jgi:transcriptional regulator with XRE-family HTH domain